MTGNPLDQAEQSERLELYRRPAYRRLFAAARRSLERTGGDLSGAVSVTGPDDAERKAIIGITGAYRHAGVGRITVRLSDLDRVVRAAAGLGLSEALAVLDGTPLRNRPAESALSADRRSALLDQARNSPLYQTTGWFPQWLDRLIADGTVTRLANQRDIERQALPQAVRVLEHLAGRGADAAPVPLPSLAETVTGDTKALSKGALPNLVLRALALQTDAPQPDTAEDIRELWDRLGVIVDDLASRVLVLNLPAAGAGLGEWLTGAARHGTPFQITLHQLTRHPVRIPAREIHVCENPAVLRRAAEELGPACPPLVCAEGRPSAAFHRLARTATQAGAALRYHGDFDWPGIAIAAQIIARHRARPWRLTAADYRAAARTGPAAAPLAGAHQPTPWDPGLAAAMREYGVALYEEAVADDLLHDLGSG